MKNEPLQIPIEDELDLHTYKPAEVRELLSEYLNACRERKFSSVRIIHGKGAGTLKRKVHSVLAKLKKIKSFHSAGRQEGGWGAIIVYLEK
ncbi:MAG: DNA mismatch repair protein MutS [Candidatus Omnitrophota bacterium]|nr:MAG: DNA mismatch repair protein MutS [Candidatus Omnitrophota bacterium]